MKEWNAPRVYFPVNLFLLDCPLLQIFWKRNNKQKNRFQFPYQILIKSSLNYLNRILQWATLYWNSLRCDYYFRHIVQQKTKGRARSTTFENISVNNLNPSLVLWKRWKEYNTNNVSFHHSARAMKGISADVSRRCLACLCVVYWVYGGRGL